MSSHITVLQILPSQVPVLVFTSIYPSVNYTGLLVTVLLLTFILQSSVLTPKTVIWSSLDPVFEDLHSFDAFLSVQFDKIVAIHDQDKLVDLEDPQVELHLLRSCPKVCKVTHL